MPEPECAASTPARQDRTGTHRDSMLAPLLALVVVWCGASSAHASVACRDTSLCNTVAQCSDRDALYRSGHLCHGFPYYNGGPPLTALHWSTVSKQYNCTVGSASGCRVWTSREVEADRFNVGSCACDGAVPSVGSCASWRCVQDAVYDCSGEEFACGAFVLLVDGSVTQGRCCVTACDNSSSKSDEVDDAVATSHRNDVSDCETAVVGRRNIAVVVTQCRCSSWIGDTAAVCGTWNCTQTAGNGSDVAVTQRLVGTCSSVPLSRSGAYCGTWSESVDTGDAFELSSCECTTTDGGMYCQAWSCDGKR